MAVFKCSDVQDNDLFPQGEYTLVVEGAVFKESANTVYLHVVFVAEGQSQKLHQFYFFNSTVQMKMLKKLCTICGTPELETGDELAGKIMKGFVTHAPGKNGKVFVNLNVEKYDNATQEDVPF